MEDDVMWLFELIGGIIVGFFGTLIIIYLFNVLTGRIKAPTSENSKRWEQNAKDQLRGKSPGKIDNPRNWFD